MNITTLLKARDRSDLIETWEDFLGHFPTAEVDDNVPCEDIYGELLLIKEEILSRYNVLIWNV